jgi:pyruvate/2-oxoglutarate dehydrogenase complex dihydrolipoamide dehydrogenase (E3) component
MAQAFRRLGAEVTLVTSHDRLLPRDDEEASHTLGNVFAAEGIDVHCSAQARRAWQDGNIIHVVAGNDEFVGDALLVAAGRRPNVDGLDLEKAGVAYTARGIQVDGHLRTSQRHIYAVGDCTTSIHGSSYQFTHYASWQAAIAVRNALLPGASKGIAAYVPWTTFTDPELAHAGMTEAQAREQFGDRVVVCHWPMTQVDRARTEGNTEGFVQLVHKADGTLLGATVVAERAGETIQEWIVALERGLKVGDIAGIIHVYPTYSSGNLRAAAAARMNQMITSPPGRIVKRLARLLK